MKPSATNPRNAGRKPKAASGEVRSARLSLRVTPSSHAYLRSLLPAEGLSIADWIENYVKLEKEQ